MKGCSNFDRLEPCLLLYGSLSFIIELPEDSTESLMLRFAPEVIGVS
jgi:hypothetical protein